MLVFTLKAKDKIRKTSMITRNWDIFLALKLNLYQETATSSLSTLSQILMDILKAL